MAVRSFPARLLKIFISSGGSGDDDWVQVENLTTLTHSPSTTEADDSDFDSGGHDEHMVMSRGDEWTLAGKAKLDTLSGERKTGRTLVEALAGATGLNSIGMFQLLWPDGTKDTFSASSEWTRPGGANNDLATWGAKLKVTGATTTA